MSGSIAVVPKLGQAITQIKVSIMSYLPSIKIFRISRRKFLCSDRS